MCPPLRTDTGSPRSTAKASARAASSPSTHRAIRAGRRSMAPFHSRPRIVVPASIRVDQDAPERRERIGARHRRQHGRAGTPNTTTISGHEIPWLLGSRRGRRAWPSATASRRDDGPARRRSALPPRRLRGRRSRSPRAQSLLAYLALQGDGSAVAPPRRVPPVAGLLGGPGAQQPPPAPPPGQGGWPDAERLHRRRRDVLASPRRPGCALDVDEYERPRSRRRTRTTRRDGRASAPRSSTRPACTGRPAPGRVRRVDHARRERLVATPPADARPADRAARTARATTGRRSSTASERLRLDPLDERVYRWLMRLHALDQDRAGALRVYQACAAVLEAELGVEPEPETRQAPRPDRRRRAGRLGRRRAPSDGGRSPSRRKPGAPGQSAPARRAGASVGRRDRGLGAGRRRRRRASWSIARRGGDRQVAAGGRARASGRAIAGRSRRLTRAWAAEGRLAYAPVADWLRSPALASRLPGSTRARSARSRASCRSC